MGWIPTKIEIEKEANDYENLGFFKKSKHVLVLFVVATFVLSYLVFENYGIELWAPGQSLVYLIPAVFIYHNHRWAIVLLPILYLGDTLSFFINSEWQVSPLPLIILGLIAVLFSYRSYRVATQLKKNAAAKDNGI